MSFGGGSGSNTTTSTQPFIQTGPTVQAAQLAGQAQISAAQIAAQAATQNTQSAIQSLMGQYSTALTYANPSINTGNQAAAQMNYMLGLPAVSPGPTPTAPKMPTLQELAAKVSSSQVNQYISQNMGLGSVNAQGNQEGPQTLSVSDPTTGYLYTANNSPPGSAQANMMSSGQFLGYAGGQSGSLAQHIRESLAQEQMTQAQNLYDNEMKQYNQQLNQWNQQSDIYDRYTAQGVAKPEDINNIVTNLPGYKANFGEGINAIEHAASASGMLGSGNILRSLDQFGQTMASTYYNTYMGQLAGLAGLGQQASGLAQQGALGTGQQLADAYSNLGNIQANSALAQGQALANSYLSPVANQQVIMTPYTTSSTTSGSQGSGGGSFDGILSGIGGLKSVFSSKQLKEPIETINTSLILDSINQLHLDKWKYKGIDKEFIGPYAEEFQELFGVGDGKTINIIDLFGVLIGSVKQLTKELNDLKSKTNV